MAGTSEHLGRELREGAARLRQSLLVRGLVAIAFGVLLLLWPGISLGAFVLTFGIVSAADGLVALYTATTPAAAGNRWRPALQGIAGILTGVVVLGWPGLSALALLYLIGAWAFVLGVVEVAAAVTGPGTGEDRAVVGVHGALSAAFGVIMWWRPGAGALALVALVAAFAILIGAMRIAAAMRLKDVADAVPGAGR